LELMIIFFVLYMFFSLLTRVFRGAADQKRRFTTAQQLPSSRKRDHTEDPSHSEGKRLTDEPDAFSWQEFLFPEDSAFPDASAAEPPPAVAVKRHTVLQKKPGSVDGSIADGSIKETGRDLTRPRNLSRPGLLQKRTGQVAPSGLDLQNYLKRENLPRTVIAAVVLGSPRSKNPLLHWLHRDRPSVR